MLYRYQLWMYFRKRWVLMAHSPYKATITRIYNKALNDGWISSPGTRFYGLYTYEIQLPPNLYNVFQLVDTGSLYISVNDIVSELEYNHTISSPAHYLKIYNNQYPPG